MIYDCFTFFNELDLLEIRLNELNDVADRFVLVEATRTHQGKPKKLVYEENKARFAAFHHKLIHVIVDEYPENPNNDPWVYEWHQRNMIKSGLKNCNPDDVIMISDVDEIPRPSEVAKVQKNLKGLVIFRQRAYYYFLNCINAGKGSLDYRWNGTVMIRFEDLKQPQDLREISMRLLGLRHTRFVYRVYWHLWKLRALTLKGVRIQFVKDGGWHFSYLGGVERIIAKLEAFAHNEYNKEEFKDPEKLKQLIESGQDILGRDFTYTFLKLDSTFPKYILDNQQRFAHLLFFKS
jgi:beta-1,4-mannosyl-glycoprotein beta-1,4-N-acetylglucosaminyltransferase